MLLVLKITSIWIIKTTSNEEERKGKTNHITLRRNTSNIEIYMDSKAANKIQYWLIKHYHWFENHKVDQRH